MSEDQAADTMAALLNPTSASIRSQRKAIASHLKEIPSMKAGRIKTLIIDNGLNWMKAGSYVCGQLGNLSIGINNKNIVVAIGVNPPHYPVIERERARSGVRSPLGYQKEREMQIHAQGLWKEKFLAILAEGDSSWRVVSLPQMKEQRFRSDRPATIWVTQVSESLWAKILPFATEEAPKVAAIHNFGMV